VRVGRNGRLVGLPIRHCFFGRVVVDAWHSLKAPLVVIFTGHCPFPGMFLELVNSLAATSQVMQ